MLLRTVMVVQKQPSRGVLRKRCSENMQHIYRIIPMPKCDFNKVALHFGMAVLLEICCFFSEYFFSKNTSRRLVVVIFTAFIKLRRLCLIQENLQEVFVIVCDCFASLEVSHFRVTFLYHQHSTLGCQTYEALLDLWVTPSLFFAAYFCKVFLLLVCLILLRVLYFE